MYAEDKPHGVWKYYYDTDTLASVSYYNQGVKVGNWVGYSFKGEKAILQSYTDSGFKYFEAFFYKGDIAYSDTIEISGTDTIHHISRFYPNKKLYCKYDVIDGKYQGDYFKFHSNGKPWEVMKMKDDGVQEVVLMKSASGKDLEHSDPKNGIILKRYHKNGDLWQQLSTTGNADTLELTYFDVASITDSRGYMVKNRPAGEWIKYSYGKKIQKIYFFDGYDHYAVNEMDLDQKVSGNVSYHGDLASGTYVEHDLFGSKTMEASFKNGYLHGQYFAVANKTGIARTGEMLYGNPTGKWVFTSNSSDRVLRTRNYVSELTLDTSLILKPKRRAYIGNACISDYKFENPVRVDDFYRVDDQIFDIIRTNRIYPGQAFELEVEGDIEIQYKVGLMGEMTEFKVVRGIGYGCNEEAIRLLKKFPFQRPSMLGGIPFESKTNMIVPFYIPEEMLKDKK